MSGRLKLNHHAAEAGGVRGVMESGRLKLNHHAAEAGGVRGVMECPVG